MQRQGLQSPEEVFASLPTTDEFMALRRDLNQPTSMESRQDAARAFEQRISAAQRSFQLIGMVSANSTTMQRVSELGLAATQMYAGYAELMTLNAGVTTAATSAAPLAAASPLVALGPAASIAMAAVVIFNAFSKKKKNDQFGEAVMRNLRVISEQVHSLHVDMREQFQQNARNQQIIYTAILEGFQTMTQLIDAQRHENHQLHMGTQELLTRLEASVNRNFTVLAESQREISLQKIRETFTKVDGWVSETLTQNPRENIEKLAGKLTALTGLNGVLASNTYTGARWVPDQMNNVDAYRVVNEVFKELNYETAIDYTGFLSVYARKHLGLQSEQVDLTAVFSPTLWNEAVEKYIQLRATFSRYISDTDSININKIIRAGNNQLAFKQLLQTTPALYQTLFAQYRAILGAIKVATDAALDERSAVINQQIAARFPVAQYPAMERINIDIKEAAWKNVAAFENKKPSKIVAKGNMISFPPMTGLWVKAWSCDHNADVVANFSGYSIPGIFVLLDRLGKEISMNYDVKILAWGGDVDAFAEINTNIFIKDKQRHLKKLADVKYSLKPIEQQLRLGGQYGSHVLVDGPSTWNLYRHMEWHNENVQFSINWSGSYTVNNVVVCNSGLHTTKLMENYWSRDKVCSVTEAGDITELKGNASIEFSEWLYEERKKSISNAISGIQLSHLKEQLNSIKKLIIAMAFVAGYRNEEILLLQNSLHDSNSINKLYNDYLNGIVSIHHDHMPHLELCLNAEEIERRMIERQSTNEYFQDHPVEREIRVALQRLNLLRLMPLLSEPIPNPAVDNNNVIAAQLGTLSQEVQELKQLNMALINMLIQLHNPPQHGHARENSSYAQFINLFGVRSNHSNVNNSGNSHETRPSGSSQPNSNNL